MHSQSAGAIIQAFCFSDPVPLFLVYTAFYFCYIVLGVISNACASSVAFIRQRSKSCHYPKLLCGGSAKTSDLVTSLKVTI